MADEWDIVVWRRADDLRRQAERIQRNFFQMAVATRYRIQQGRNARWEPPVNVIETDESLWVISALPGVSKENVGCAAAAGGRKKEKGRVVGHAREVLLTAKRPVRGGAGGGHLNRGEFP